MIYKEIDILARCHIQGSDLFETDDEGSPTEAPYNVFIEHEDDRIVVWYEAGEMEHLSVTDPPTKETLYFIEVKTIEELKRRIDLYQEQNPED